MSQCPCGSGQPYEACCGQYLEKGVIPPSPEALMRSRYTAYTQANVDYIEKTMRGPAQRKFNAKDAKQWALSARWDGLEVVSAPAPESDTGFVTFIARFTLNNEPDAIYERSEFEKVDGRWYYLKEHPYDTGPVAQVKSDKVGRNEPCPCGSGKKYKKCCMN